MSLVAVFLPILLMGGIVGRLFREFAVTLSVAIVVSAGGLADHHADDVRARCCKAGETGGRPWCACIDGASGSSAVLRGYERASRLGAAARALMLRADSLARWP